LSSLSETKSEEKIDFRSKQSSTKKTKQFNEFTLSQDSKECPIQGKIYRKYFKSYSRYESLDVKKKEAEL
jgi:hypothetical protein